MLSTTMEALKAILRADVTIDPAEREKILASLKTPAEQTEQVRVLNPTQVAQILGRTTRTVATMRRKGLLVPVRMAGAARVFGYRSDDVYKLIGGGAS